MARAQKLSHSFVPLVDIPSGAELLECTLPTSVAREVVAALQKSGFLLIKTPLMSANLQARALDEATNFLERSDSPSVILHPNDPKMYAMLDYGSCLTISPVLAKYYEAMEKAKFAVLRCIAVGLDLEPSYFTHLHSENNSSLRLIRYHSGTKLTGNRCKEHSDYGSITLLSTDGVSGLEAFHCGQWLPVPHVEGALIVNVGSLMSSWTAGSLLATLHRVAGPASKGTQCSPASLLEAIGKARTSIAFFADPNKNVSAVLEKEHDANNFDGNKGMSVANYIRWRSGGRGESRSGVALTEDEARRVEEPERS